MEELCSVCLCSERNLTLINETSCYQVYLQILNEISVYDTSQLCVRICWECRALLLKLQTFKLLVKTSYNDLVQCAYQNLSQKPLAKTPRLNIQNVVNLSYPVLKVKEEKLQEPISIDNDSVWSIENGFEQVSDIITSLPVEFKKEDSEGEDHCEPETFVNDLKVNKPSRKKKATKVQVKKVKSNKVKVTKKKPQKVQRKGRKRKIVKEKAVESDIDVDTNYNESEWDDDTDRVGGESKTDLLRCEDCDIVFDDQEEFNKHLDSVHVLKVTEETDVGVSDSSCKVKEGDSELSEKPVCVECGKVFSSRKTLRYHRNVLHKGQNQHPCPRCGKVYQWKSNLGRHMRSHKARDSDELYCEKCDKRFASVATFRQHLKISLRHVSESEFSFVCNECGKKFVNKVRLRDHIDWDHLKKIKFRCELCNKPFKCHTSLYIHMQNVHSNKDKKDNLCHVCGKSYQNAAKLKYHIVALHSGATPYSCPQCNASFGWYSSLYRHLREVHYKMKVQPNKKSKKLKKPESSPPLAPNQIPSLVPQMLAPSLVPQQATTLLSQQLSLPAIPPRMTTVKQ